MIALWSKPDNPDSTKSDMIFSVFNKNFLQQNEPTVQTEGRHTSLINF